MLFVVKEVAKLTAYCTAIIALLTMLLSRFQIQKIIPAISNAENPSLRTWHRWAGWITLAGLVINSAINMLAGVRPTLPFEMHNYAHGVLMAPCALTILSKIWLERRKEKRRIKQGLSWGVVFFVFGASFFSLTCALGVWPWTRPTMTWGQHEWLIYQVTVLGHAGLGIALIWLGRLALAQSNASDRMGALAKHNRSREQNSHSSSPMPDRYKRAISISTFTRRNP